jgi:uncharacterized protein
LALFAGLLPVENALAQAMSDSHRLALDALTLEFSRHNVTGTEEELTERFRKACDAGYNPACQRGAWLVYGKPDLQLAESAFEYGCETGDPVACMVVGWSLDARAPQSEERNRTWKKAARIFKTQCDDGFTPACHEYAWFLYDNKGLKADPRAAPLRWKPACESGYQPSCTTLGSLQIIGAEGVRRDPKGGQKLLDDACAAGHMDACYRIGLAKDETWEVEAWETNYAPLCEGGHSAACWRLGSRYLNGSLKSPEENRASVLLEMGCALQHPKACQQVGRIHEHADPPDDEKAGAYFGRACLLGDIEGCTSQTEMILAGRIDGSVKDSTSAFEFACLKRSLPGACTALALELMRGVDLPRDPVRARALLQRSCVDEASATESCAALGLAYEDGQGGDRDRTTAAKYYRWACNAGDLTSCLRRGDLLTTGRGIERDDHEALAMYRRACEGETPAACFKGGLILEDGTYVTRDVAQAIELYQQGCAGGNGDACARQGWLKEEGAHDKPDFEAARAAYEEGILLTSTEAKRRMSRLLWNGLGGPKQRRRAKKLAVEACRAGDAVACRGAAFL